MAGPIFDTQILAVVPTNATTGKIRVEISSTIGDTTTNNFYVIAPSEPPFVESFSPVSGPTNSLVVLTGANITNASTTVWFGNASASWVPSTNRNQIIATVPVHATTAPVTVMDSFGTNSTSSNFVVTVLAPIIQAFSPAYAPTNTDVTITGLNFSNVVMVKFNGAGASFRAGSLSNQIIATVPAGASSGPISVGNSFGTGSTTSNFLVTGGSPGISTFTPNAGGNGTIVSITGSNLIDSTSVRFAGVLASFTVVSATQIQATVPPGATSGPISVANPYGTNSTSANFYLAPLISMLSPASGRVGSQVTIVGSNFLDATAVDFNGTPASFSVTSDTTLQATVPAGAGDGPVRVTAPGGTVLSTMSFSVLTINDLAVGMIASKSPVAVGSNTIVLISVTNLGPDTAASAEVVHSFSSNAFFVGATSNPGTLSTNGNQVTAQFGALLPGATATLAVTLRGQTAFGFLTNDISASSSNTETNLSNNTASLVIPVVPVGALMVRRLANRQLELSWPTNLAGYTLESAPLLAGTNSVWSPVAGTPTIVSNLYLLTNGFGTTNQIYRLKIY